MNQIGAIAFVVGIIGLFLLDRDRQTENSKALWLPVIWIIIAGSRSVTQWLQLTPPASADAYLDGSPLDRMILTVLMAIGIMVLLKRGRKTIALLRLNAPILLFFFYCALSVLWSDYPDITFKRWFKAMGDLIMVLIVLTDPDWQGAIKRLLARTGFVLIPASILFIKYFPALGRRYSGWGEDSDWKPVYIGVATDKNMLGTVCMIIGLGFVWRFLQALRGDQDHRKGQLFARGILIAMVVWLFWVSNSVTSTACFAMATGFLMVTSIPMLARRTSVVHILVLGMISIALFGLFFDPTGGVVQAMGRNSTLTDRTGIWKLVLSIPINPLFGTGFESFWLGQRLLTVWRSYGGVQEAHNGYLEIYLNLGWIGVALLAMVILTGYKNAVAAFRQDPEIGRLRLVYLATALVYSLSEAGFRTRGPIWIFLLLATIAIPKRFAPEKFDVTEETPAPDRDADVLLSTTHA